MKLLTLKEIGKLFFETSRISEIEECLWEGCDGDGYYYPYDENGMSEENVLELVQKLKTNYPDTVIDSEDEGYKEIAICPQSVEAWAYIYSYIYEKCW